MVGFIRMNYKKCREEIIEEESEGFGFMGPG